MNEQIQEQLKQINERVMDSLIEQANQNKARRRSLRNNQEPVATEPEPTETEVESPVLTQWNAILDQILKRR